MTERETVVYKEYRFVAHDGRATKWRKIPKLGVAGMQMWRARRELGENINLQMRGTHGEEQSR